MNRALPIMLRLEGRAVLVVGGGRVAAAKARLLVDAGAEVTMVAPRFCPAALELAGVRRYERCYQPGDLVGTWLCVTAVDSLDVTAAVAGDAERSGVFCNAADRPDHCSATLMATLREGDVTVAVSTNGRSPAAAGWLRNRIARDLGGRAGRLVAGVAGARDRIRAQRSSEGLAWFDLLDELDHTDEHGAAAVVEQFVADALQEARPANADSTATVAGSPPGTVVLVGAGPGDPDLLTLGAARALAAADVIVHDALIGDAIFELFPGHAEVIDVGKRPGRPVPQELINALLVQLAGQGRRVVRLKGGDPYLFGRGGEEAIALQRHGIAFTVIPGISSALAAPALAGVPVTHRGVAAAVTIITGHRAEHMAPVDWSAVADLGGTLVVLMGVAQRGAIADALQDAGMDPDTPVAAIEAASHPDERVIRTTLARLGSLTLRPPATLVIGAVAGLDLRPQDTGPSPGILRWAAMAGSVTTGPSAVSAHHGEVLGHRLS